MKWERETRWIHYDRESYQIFRKAGETQAIELVDAAERCAVDSKRVYALTGNGDLLAKPARLAVLEADDDGHRQERYDNDCCEQAHEISPCRSA